MEAAPIGGVARSGALAGLMLWGAGIGSGCGPVDESEAMSPTLLVERVLALASDGRWHMVDTARGAVLTDGNIADSIQGYEVRDAAWFLDGLKSPGPAAHRFVGSLWREDDRFIATWYALRDDDTDFEPLSYHAAHGVPGAWVEGEFFLECPEPNLESAVLGEHLFVEVSWAPRPPTASPTAPTIASTEGRSPAFALRSPRFIRERMAARRRCSGMAISIGYRPAPGWDSDPFAATATNPRIWSTTAPTRAADRTGRGNGSLDLAMPSRTSRRPRALGARRGRAERAARRGRAPEARVRRAERRRREPAGGRPRRGEAAAGERPR
jgi:hypothetical protein